MKPRVYLVGRSSRREELLSYAHELEEIGFDLSCRWLLGGHQVPDTALADETGDQGFAPARRAQFAIEDVVDERRADLVIVYTEPPRSAPNRGGRHVELGLALAWQKDLILVGPRENVFCCLPEIAVVADWTEGRALAREWLEMWEQRQ